MKTAYFILGMHRSGTSALGGTLNILGLDFGTDLMPETSDNPKGYFENNKVYQLNETILRESKASWDDYSFDENSISDERKEHYISLAMEIIKEEFRYSENFAIKDPRNCMLFSIWEQACKNLNIDIKVFIPYRNPAEVALSLKKRDDFSFEKSILLWSKHFLDAEYISRNYDRMFCSFDDLVKKRKKLLEELAHFTNMELDEDKVEEIELFLDKSSKHNNISLQNFTKNAPQFLIKLVDIINKKKFDDEKQFDVLRDDFYYSLEMFQHAEIRETIDAQAKEINDLSNKVEQLEKIAEIGSFDEAFYALEYSDLHEYDGDLREHYVKYGKSEHRFPNAYCKSNSCDVSDMISKDEELYNKEAEIKSLNDNVNEMAEDIQTLKTTKEAEITELHEQTTQKSNELEVLNSEYSVKKEELEKQNEQLQIIQSELQNTQETNVGLQRSLQEKEAEIENLNNEINKVVEDLSTIKESKCWIYTKPLRTIQKKLTVE